MNAGPDVERLIAGWLVDEAADGAPDRVLESTRKQLTQTRQRHVAAWRPPMNTRMARLTALAAGLVLAVGALVLLPRLPSGTGGPSTPTGTPTPAASAAPSGLPTLPPGGAIEPGTYQFGAPFGLDVVMTFSTAEWASWNDGVRTKQVAPFYKRTPDSPNLGIIIAQVPNLYEDACSTAVGLLDPPLGPTVDDFVTAVSAQSRTEATDPTEVTISGYAGKHLQIEFLTSGACPILSRWRTDAGDRLAIPGERDELWVLNVQGERWVIDLFSFEDTAEIDIAEARAIIDSLTLNPRS